MREFLSNVKQVIKGNITIRQYKSRIISVQIESKIMNKELLFYQDWLEFDGYDGYLAEYQKYNDVLKGFDFIHYSSFVMKLKDETEIILYGTCEWIELDDKDEWNARFINF